MDWMDMQMKRIKGGHQEVWGHNLKIIRAKQKHALVDDHSSFEMRWMATRTDQLIHIAEAISSKIYTRESETEAQGLAKALVMYLKQFHTHSPLHTLSEGDNQGYGGSLRPTLKWCLLAFECVG